MKGEALQAAQVAVEHLPYVTAAAGAAIGTVMEYRVQSRLAAADEVLHEDFGDIVAEQPELSRLQRLRRALGVLTVAGAAAGSVIGMAWEQEAAPAPEKPHINYVVDRSGATALGKPGERAKDEIDEDARLFAESDVRVNAFVARFDDVDRVKINEVSRQSAVGDAPLDEALNSALQSEASTIASGGPRSQRNSAVVIETNGNTFGQAETVVARANASPARPRIYVVNVKESANEKTKSLFKEITKQTGGAYMESIDRGDVRSFIKDLQPAKPESEKDIDWKDNLIKTAAGLAMFGFFARQRRKFPLKWRNDSNDESKEK